MRASRGMGAISAAKRPQQKQRRDDTSFTEYAEGGKVDPEEAKRQRAIALANAESEKARKKAAMKGLRGVGPSASKAYTGASPKQESPELEYSPAEIRNPKLTMYRREDEAERKAGLKSGLAKGGKVNAAGNYTKPEMRKSLFNSIKGQATQGTGAGEWSARKAQLLAKKYKAKGGGYRD